MAHAAALTCSTHGKREEKQERRWQMRYRIHQIKLRPGDSKERIPRLIQKKIGAEIKDWVIRRESVDARDKQKIRLVYTVDFTCRKKLKLDPAPDLSYKEAQAGNTILNHRPVVAGFGPLWYLRGVDSGGTGVLPHCAGTGARYGRAGAGCGAVLEERPSQ